MARDESKAAADKIEEALNRIVGILERIEANSEEALALARKAGNPLGLATYKSGPTAR